MLHRLSDLSHYTLRPIDGPDEANSEGKATIGVVTGFYFDQQQWRIHSIVVELGNWAASNEVLINPSDIAYINTEDKTFACSLTVKQIKNSLSANDNELAIQKDPIRRLPSFQYPSEWHDIDDNAEIISNSKSVSLKALKLSDPVKITLTKSHLENPLGQEMHLRLCDSMIDFDVEATDDRLGSIEELLIDESSWDIHYFIVTTSRWWNGHQVLIAPSCIKFVNWVNRIICIDLTQQQGLHSPIFESRIPMRREKELEYSLYFGRNGFSKSHQIQVDKIAS